MKLDKDVFKISFKGRMSKEVFEESTNTTLWILAMASFLLLALVISGSVLFPNLQDTPTAFSVAVFLLAVSFCFYALYLFVHFFSSAVRRFHDLGFSGWRILLVFIPLLGIVLILPLFVTSGDPGTNKYGEPG